MRFPIILYVQALYGKHWLTITLAATAWEYSLSAVMLYGKSTQDQSPNFWFITCDWEKVLDFWTMTYTDSKNRYPAMMKTVVFNDHHHIQKKKQEEKNRRENPSTSRTPTISPDSGKATIRNSEFMFSMRASDGVFFFRCLTREITSTIKV